MIPTEAEVREAESQRYGLRVIRLLPLSSGNFAVLGFAWEPIGYANDLAEAIEIGHKWAEGEETEMERERRRKMAEPATNDFNPEDLGL